MFESSMSETSQAEVGCLVELWVLMLSKKRIVCGYLSMETLLFQFYFSASFFSFAVCLSVHGSASECSFSLTGYRCDFQHLCLMTSDNVIMNTHIWVKRTFRGVGEKPACFLVKGRRGSVWHWACLKFWIPVLITKLPHFFFFFF